MRKKTVTVRGFSLIELLFAGAIFVIFAGSIVEILLTGLEADRLGEETTIAGEYAAQGIEAVRSLASGSFDGLTETGATGISRADGRVVFSGSEDTFGKYTRIISVEGVNRDGSGNIDEQGGDPDPDTKKVTVTVSWDVTSSRADSVIVETYLTRWKP